MQRNFLFLNCNIFSDVAWFRGPTLLVDTGDRLSLIRRRNEFSFSIFDPWQSDAGLYSCLAVNPTGEKWHQFKLDVKGIVDFSTP